MTGPGEFTPDPNEYPEPADNGGEQPSEGFDPGEVFHQGDGVTADETDQSDLDDTLPKDGGSPGTDEASGRNQEIASFLDSLPPHDGSQPEVSAEDQKEAWRVAAEASLEFLDQGQVHKDPLLGGDARTDTIGSDEGTAHTLEVIKTPADKVKAFYLAFKIIVRADGDEHMSGRGAEYKVDDQGVVTRKDIEPRPRDLEGVEHAMDVSDLRDARRQGPEAFADSIVDLIARGLAGAMERARMGVGPQPIGPLEAQGLAHLLIGRYIRPEGYDPENPTDNV